LQQILLLDMKNLEEAILQKSLELFMEYGIRNVSIDTICNELRISKKTFYSYFKQKEELVDAILTYDEKINVEEMRKIFDNKNAIESLISVLKEIKKNIDCQPKRMWLDIKKYYPKVYQKHETRRRSIIRKDFEMNLQQGVKEGFYREDLDIELLSVLHSYQLKNIMTSMSQYPKKYSKKRIVDFFIDIIIHIIANEKGLEYVRKNYYESES